MKLNITKVIGKEVFIVMKVNPSRSYSKPLKWIVKSATRQSKCSLFYDVVFVTYNNEEVKVTFNSKHNMFMRIDVKLQASDLAFIDPLTDVDLVYDLKECYVFSTREDALKFYKEKLCEIRTYDEKFFNIHMKQANDCEHRLNEVEKALLICNANILSLEDK